MHNTTNDPGTHLLITADLGRLRAYRLVQGRTDQHPHLELLQEVSPVNARQKRGDQVSDRPGRFARGTGPAHIPGDLSSGEQHDWQLEQKHRLTKLLAHHINTLLEDRAVAGCSLAVGTSIHVELLEHLTAAARAKLDCLVTRDLTRTPPDELLGHFAAERARPARPVAG